MDQYTKSSLIVRFFKRIFYVCVALVVLAILAVVLSYIFLFSAPRTFTPQTIRIEQGEPLISIGQTLEEGSIVRSGAMFQTLVIFLGGEKRLQPGEYYFEHPVSVFGVAVRFVARDFGILKHRVTFPEGITRTEMATILKTRIPEFDTQTFLELTKDKEGYLFPDTYYFFPRVTPEEVVKTLEDNFGRKILSISKDFEKSDKKLSDVVIMASIIEKEAYGENDRAVVSGILWERIRVGMLLQVDAPFLFLLGKKSSELTLSDLAISSPYNTYKYKGLPPGPIGNPGLEALKAALHPEKSPYLFYLHDEHGTIHYAKNFEEHKRNKIRYLN